MRCLFSAGFHHVALQAQGRRARRRTAGPPRPRRPGSGQRVGAVRVPDAEGDLDGLGVAAGQRDAADVGEKELSKLEGCVRQVCMRSLASL